MTSKFILFEYGFAVFSPGLQPDRMARCCKEQMGDPVQAGFVRFENGEPICYGDSFSLGLKAEEDASAVLKRCMEQDW